MKKFYRVENWASRRDNYDHCDYEGFDEKKAIDSYSKSQVDAKRELESNYYKGDDSVEIIFSAYEIPDDLDLDFANSIEKYLINQQSCTVEKENISD